MTASPQRAVRTYLEMRAPSDLQPAPPPSSGAVVERANAFPPDAWRRLYTEVGHDYHWVDRLGWTDEDITRYLADPALELWLLKDAGELAGYFELRKDADGAVEIAYFGLLPPAIGRGLGKYLLTRAVEQAWARGATRVWVHTSSLDHASALPNYLARGFAIWKQETYDVV